MYLYIYRMFYTKLWIILIEKKNDLVLMSILYMLFLQGDLFSESVPEKKPSKKIVESEEEEEEEGKS